MALFLATFKGFIVSKIKKNEKKMKKTQVSLNELVLKT